MFTFPKPKGEVSALKMISIFLVGDCAACPRQHRWNWNLKERKLVALVHWMSGGNVDLQKARLHFEAQRTAGCNAVLWCQAIRAMGGGWNSTEGSRRLLSLNLGGRPLVLGEAGLVWRCAATPMPTFGHVGPRNILPVRRCRINRIVMDPSDDNHWYACAPSGGGFGISPMLASLGVWLMCWHH